MSQNNVPARLVQLQFVLDDLWDIAGGRVKQAFDRLGEALTWDLPPGERKRLARIHGGLARIIDSGVLDRR